MPNPPTQGRTAIERGAKVLREWSVRHSEKGLRAHAEEIVADILAAAYPQQTEGDEREWTLVGNSASSWQTVAAGPSVERGEQVPVVPKSRLAAAGQRALKQRIRTEEYRRITNELRADRDRLQRERDKLRFEAMLHVQEIPLEPAEQNSWLKHEVDRLQRELAQQTESLTEIAQQEHEKCDRLQRELDEWHQLAEQRRADVKEVEEDWGRLHEECDRLQRENERLKALLRETLPHENHANDDPTGFLSD